MFHNEREHMNTFNQIQTLHGQVRINTNTKHDILNITIGHDNGIISCFGIQKMKNDINHHQYSSI